MTRPKRTAPLPSKDELRDFIRNSATPVGKREIARAFQIRGDDRIPLKALLKELKAEGAIERPEKKRLARPGALPGIAVVEIVGPDADGELMARPEVWPEDLPPPRIYMAPERRGTPALEPGARVLAQLKRIEPEVYEGRTIKRLHASLDRVIGVYRLSQEGGKLIPTDRRNKNEYRLARAHASGARDGELILAEVLPSFARGVPEVRVLERLGDVDGPKAISLIAIHERDIPTVFPEAAIAEAESAEPAPLGEREDLRRLPLVTIDGADARDFDDAVHAEADPSPDYTGGWRVTVAIADVAHYVRPASALDRAAYERGNSVYLPDRVVPMLPEALSNDLCSLKSGVDRAVMVVRMRIDAEGNLLEHRFQRALMRSAARLTYEQVQAAADGRPDETTRPLVDRVIRPLYGAFAAFDRARARRGTLELDLPERKVILDADGKVLAIKPRARLASHRLIEECMIAANVAAAETLEARKQPCMYRVHDQPDPERVEALRKFLEGLELKLARGKVLRPADFTRLLRQAEGKPYQQLINDLVLRSQAQAVYSPDNLGHFGLALRRYAHFTSPIRRYADVLVHRALIAGLHLGAGALPKEEAQRFPEMGEHISATERRAAAAERDAVDRFAASFLAERVGQVFAARISGVTRFGLFVRLEETGADGLVPISSLGPERFFHDEQRHQLLGQRSRTAYRLGDAVEVKLREANPVTGGLLFQLEEDAAKPVKSRGFAHKKRTSRRR
ncbi:MAG: ribonuclease R [Proteobacteria bacterium]|nr:ribonuclease R [Pseudomonadota bacterium]MBI3497682.1 ribonuclease R [Pseudomonadota bacterium]